MKAKEEPKQEIDMSKYISGIDPYDTQETLEEAAERIYPISKGGSMWMPSADDCNKANKQEGFIAGAKWQAERMYSEEETYRILHKLMMEIHIDGLLIADDTDLKMWFEQFKKK